MYIAYLNEKIRQKYDLHDDHTIDNYPIKSYYIVKKDIESKLATNC